MRARQTCSLVAALLVLTTAAGASAQAGADAARGQRLQQRQLEDALRLQTQQGLSGRGTLSPSDARRLDELHRRQRAEQQQLNGQQLLLDRQRAVDPDDSALRMRQRLLDQERELQLQRFELERQELLRSAKPRPLQRPAPVGALPPD